MSLLKANSIQIGQSNTATNNFTLSAADQNGTIKLSRGNSGATITDVLTINSNGAVSLNNGGIITLGTAVNAATGSPTSIDFTGIPSWVKKITVILNGISTNGTSLLQLQIGSGSYTITGYNSGAWTANVTNTGLITSGFVLCALNSASATYYGNILLTLIGSNSWVESHSLGGPVGGFQSVGGGSVTLGNSLDRVRLTTVNGTDTFDAGTINIMYEG